jgi:hypothetical protein
MPTPKAMCWALAFEAEKRPIASKTANKPKYFRYRIFKNRNDRYRILGILLDPCYIHETRVGEESCKTACKAQAIIGLRAFTPIVCEAVRLEELGVVLVE